jgi:hypothetical protein
MASDFQREVLAVMKNSLKALIFTCIVALPVLAFAQPSDEVQPPSPEAGTEMQAPPPPPAQPGNEGMMPAQIRQQQRMKGATPPPGGEDMRPPMGGMRPMEAQAIMKQLVEIDHKVDNLTHLLQEQQHAQMQQMQQVQQMVQMQQAQMRRPDGAPASRGSAPPAAKPKKESQP